MDAPKTAAARLWATKDVRNHILTFLTVRQQCKILAVDRQTFPILAGMIWKKMTYLQFVAIWPHGIEAKVSLRGPQRGSLFVFSFRLASPSFDHRLSVFTAVAWVWGQSIRPVSLDKLGTCCSLFDNLSDAPVICLCLQDDLSII